MFKNCFVLCLPPSLFRYFSVFHIYIKFLDYPLLHWNVLWLLINHWYLLQVRWKTCRIWKCSRGHGCCKKDWGCRFFKWKNQQKGCDSRFWSTLIRWMIKAMLFMYNLNFFACLDCFVEMLRRLSDSYVIDWCVHLYM